MAQIVFTNAFHSVNGTDLSSFTKGGTLDISRTMLDDTVMGDSAQSNAAGIQSWSLSVDYVQDYASGGPHQTIFALDGAAAFTVIIQPTNAAESSTNPKFTGSAVLQSYNPVAGRHGDLLMCRAQYACAGLLTADTTP